MKSIARLLILLMAMLVLASSQPTEHKKTVHVREYTRKDGVVVHAHDRAAPAAAKVGPKKSTTPSAGKPASIARDERGRIARSAAAKHSFESSHPCPATGRGAGPCPGYVIDHVNPLACGGADAPENMQWQSVAEAKVKDRTERLGCVVR